MGFSRVVEVAVTGSTNADVMAGLTARPDHWPHLAVLVARRQTAGRGRAGRSWVTSGEGALTCSVVLAAPRMPLPWVPLVVGLAVRDAVSSWLPVALKWPNDVVLDEPPEPGEWGWGRKVGGVLCELHPGGLVVAGIGVNCRQPAADLPVPWAASIASAGVDAPAPLDVLESLGVRLAGAVEAWERDPATVRAAYASACVTIGHRVGVDVPGGAVVRGFAAAIATDGALVVVDDDGTGHAVSVGDVQRVR